MCLNHPELVVVRVVSMRFAVLEPPRIIAEAPCTPCFPCNNVQREGSVQANLNKVCRVLFSIYIVAGETRCAWCLCPSSGWFKHSEPLHYRESKVWRVLTHAFGVVRPYRNVSFNIVKGETRRAG